MAEGEGTGRTGDRLKQLRAFCHAARLESMSKAAERLDISQPAVSQHIRALEREFATPFFERRGPRITLTPAGAGLYRLAMPLVQGVERLPETFAEHVNGEAMGEVRVLAGLTASTFLLPDYLKRFRAVHEGVKVTLRTGGLADGLGLLHDREVDFALGGVETVPERLDFHPFRTWRPLRATCAPSAYLLIRENPRWRAAFSRRSRREIPPWERSLYTRG